MPNKIVLVGGPGNGHTFERTDWPRLYTFSPGHFNEPYDRFLFRHFKNGCMGSAWYVYIPKGKCVSEESIISAIERNALPPIGTVHCDPKR